MKYLIMAGSIGLFALAAAHIFALSDSGEFPSDALDTHSAPANSGHADSGAFVLDTRTTTDEHWVVW